MSTISSQLIVTSSALIEDLYKTVQKNKSSEKTYVFLGRIAILVVSIVAMALAWQQNDTILALVSFAWAGFGAAFGPTILLSLYWRKINSIGALAGMVVGAVTVIIWGNLDLELTKNIYEIIPGFVLNLIVTIIVSLRTHKENPEIEREFNEALELLNSDKD